MDDLCLLRTYEPVLRFTRGEQFFPMDAQRYVEHCVFEKMGPDGVAVEAVPRGGMTLDRLSTFTPDNGADTRYFLRFSKPLSRQDYERMLRYLPVRRFHPGPSRLARVGTAARALDSIYTVLLLLRGKVPGGTAANAYFAYQRIEGGQPCFRYYGRVVRDVHFVALQYLMFYAMDDWRSGFHGANDHEADWEQVIVYLAASDTDELEPAWVAYAAHDRFGDDQRRRWDDPELEKVGTHPVVYVGAGSHAAYFAPGEYVADIEVPFMTPVARVLGWIRYVVLRAFRQVRGMRGEEMQPLIVRMPFIDYARGDGLAIGPGERVQWSPELLDPVPAWVTAYRGLWGLFVRDPLAGENAPAGPMYNRDGSVRRSWYDPVGWAGLHKVSPPVKTLQLLEEEIERERRERVALQQAIIDQKARVARLGIQVDALRQHAFLRAERRARETELTRANEELDQLEQRLANQPELEEVTKRYHDRLVQGDLPSSRAHIQRALRPQSEAEIRAGKLAELWAALSIGLLLVGFTILFFTTVHWFVGLLILIGVMILVEATLRRELQRLSLAIVNLLAIASAIILLYHWFIYAAIAAVTIIGLLLIIDNVRELTR